MVTDAVNAIYKNGVTMKEEFNPNEEGRRARDEYTAKLRELYQPVLRVAEDIIEETIESMGKT